MGPPGASGGGKTSRCLGRSIMQEGRKRVEGARMGECGRQTQASSLQYVVDCAKQGNQITFRTAYY
ncbi:hypothetical protein E2C01_043200 [Portunus trituberculatus]|uniref:Uncharacterized protein n=1 Tax=Portunus trituberculatus TaxID=210409 RepID=A0A5B7FPN0_PORTR|nr:hypothetical protein [Portunus trituberculatus]